MFYVVSVRACVQLATPRRDERWTDLPTFFLDASVQGIVDEPHAEKIVRRMMAKLGYTSDMLSVQVCATALLTTRGTGGNMLSMTTTEIPTSRRVFRTTFGNVTGTTAVARKITATVQAHRDEIAEQVQTLAIGGVTTFAVKSAVKDIADAGGMTAVFVERVA